MLSHFFAEADGGVAHGAHETGEVGLLGFDDAVDTVEGKAAVVTDDAAAGIVVGQTGEEAERTETADFFGINVKHAVVVSLAEVGEDILNLGAHFGALLGASLFYHLDTTEGLDGTAKELVGLQTYNEFVVLVDVAGLVGADGRNRIGVERTNTAVGAFLFECLKADVPEFQRTFCGAYQEGGIAFVRGEVTANKVRHIDLFVPGSFNKVHWSKDLRSE